MLMKMTSRLNEKHKSCARGGRAGAFFAAALVLALLAVAAACSPAPAGDGTGGAGQTQAPGASTNEATGHAGGSGVGSPDVAFPYTFTDDAGREVTIPREPQRIVVLGPSNAEILYAIGRGDRVVGVDDFADYPPEVEALPRIGGVTNPNYEQIVALEADLFLSTSGAEEIADTLAGLGIPSAIVQPETFEDILNSILWLGKMTGAEAEAMEVVDTMTARVEAIQTALAGAEPVPVYLEIWDDPLMTVGPGSFMDELLTMAGGLNIAYDAAIPWPEISLETIVDRDPQVIFAYYEHNYRALINGERPGWSNIAAIKNGRVHFVEETLVSRPGPRIVEGLELLARHIHPERFE